MLTEVSLKNFKCFEEIKIDDLRDISLITGVNNVGKSAILNAKFDWKALNLGNYRQNVYKHEIERNIGISCKFKLLKEEKNRIKKYFDRKINTITYTVIITSNDSIFYEKISIDDIDIVYFGREHTEDPKELAIIVDIDYEEEKIVLEDPGVELFIDLDMSRSSLKYPLSWKVRQSELDEMPIFKIVSEKRADV